jgi:arabinofuranan 3-O-arabinosyltransferase
VADRVTPTTSPPVPSSDYVIPPRYWAWLGTRRAVAALVWLAAIGVGVGLTYRSIHMFDAPRHVEPERKRPDGNNGHTQIDFGGQWAMGRMIVTGNGRQLYHRQKQWQVVRDSFPEEDESQVQREESRLPRNKQSQARPDEDFHHDATNLMSWFMGYEKEPHAEWKKLAGAAAAPFAQPIPGQPLAAAALEQAAADTVTPELSEKLNEPMIGGPLYPPVHALMYAPLALIDRPQVAYHVFQLLCALLVPVAALGVTVLTRGRIWWSFATLCIFTYPGARGGLDLGQNPVVSLCIAVWGWALASRGRNVAGGMVWGLFAFKPVWGAALFLVPLLMRRWRFALAMVLTGAALAAATLPVVGIESWFHWLRIGSDASELYKTSENWIDLSRDLQGLPRRALTDFSMPYDVRSTPLINALAWGVWGSVLAATVAIYLFRADRTRSTGVGAGFLFLGAYLTCFHFMYYDALISVAALAVLFAGPRRFFRLEPFAIEPAAAAPSLVLGRALPEAATSAPLGARMLGYMNSFPLTLVAAMFLMENSLSGMELEATAGIRYFATPATDGSTSPKVPRLRVDTTVRFPTDTFLLMGIWAWCGWRLLYGEERRVEDRKA